MDNVVELFPVPPELTGTVSVFAEGKKVKGTKGRARYVAPRHVEIDFKLTDEGVVILMDDLTSLAGDRARHRGGSCGTDRSRA